MGDYKSMYPRSVFERRRDQHEFQVFIGSVLTVDYERKVCTIVDQRSGVTYNEVTALPANSSSPQATDVNMPEMGSTCVCAHIDSDGGFHRVAILNWIVSETTRAQQGIAIRPIDSPNMDGYNWRQRGVYRKAWPGQKATTTTEGYSEKEDDGWDRLSADFSRDRLDPLSRTWTQVTSRKVQYTDAGYSVTGPIRRDGAQGLASEMLPDGTAHSIVYLAPGAQASDRYVSGKQDVIPFVENAVKVQEFALDFPVPAEIISDTLLDTVLGTTGNLWNRTTTQTTGPISFDSQSFLVNQTWDSPTSLSTKPVGPTQNEGVTPQRRGFIIERSEGTLVGSNRFDSSTYGKVLKPVVFPYTQQGRFGADVESFYLGVNDSTDHIEARLAASAYSIRFPHEYNTTRWDVTKEGFTSFEIGSTLPKENIQFNPLGSYEHPHGAGRSLEGHLVGSLKLVIGKNRDEEDAIDLQALGQTVLRLGADDTSLPNARRSVQTQMRGQNDLPLDRTLQYWTQPKCGPGDAGSLTNKVGMESISLRGALDGGLVMRFGARNPNALRRHLINGYSDAPGVNAYSVGDSKRVDSKSPGRPAYSPGDSNYAFHDLTQAGKSQFNLLPYYWSGSPVTSMDSSGLSVDFHAVRDILIRAGQNELSGQSLLLDLAGGIAACVGKDKKGRSITASLDGGVELTIGSNAQNKALRIEFNGDVDWLINGNFHLHVTGDTVFESTTHQHIAKTNHLIQGQNILHAAQIQLTNQAPEIVNNQGVYMDDVTV